MWGLLFIYINFLFIRLQRLYWKITGLGAQIEARRHGQYEDCAHVLNIVARKWFFPYYIHDKELFMTLHDRFVSPRTVLADDVTLYTVTPDEAVFVRCPSHVDVCKSNAYPFLYEGQFENATQIITIPVKHFFRLVSELDQSKAKIMFIFSTGRCGSTLLVQLLEAVPGAIALSEPAWAEGLSKLHRDGIYIGDLLRACVKFSSSFGQGPFCCFKCPSFTADLMEVVTKELPEAKIVFMYRKVPMKTLESYYLLYRRVFPRHGLRPFYTKEEYRRLQFAKTYNPDFFNFKVNIKDLYMIQMSVTKAMYLDLYQNHDSVALRYEDLLENTDAVMRGILNHCGINMDGTKLDWASVMKQDSQETSIFSRSRSKISYTPRNDLEFTRRLEELEIICKPVGLEIPQHDEEWNLPGTVKVEK